MNKPSFESMQDSPIESLIGDLGFSENHELSELRAEIIRELQRDRTRAGELKGTYQLQAEQSVGEREGEAYVKAQIALLLQLALMKQQAGLSEEYVEELTDAAGYAYEMNLDDVVERIESLVSENR